MKLEQSLVDLCQQHDLTSLGVSVIRLTDRHFFTAAAHTDGRCELSSAGPTDRSDPLRH